MEYHYILHVFRLNINVLDRYSLSDFQYYSLFL